VQGAGHRGVAVLLLLITGATEALTEARSRPAVSPIIVAPPSANASAGELPVPSRLPPGEFRPGIIVDEAKVRPSEPSAPPFLLKRPARQGAPAVPARPNQTLDLKWLSEKGLLDELDLRDLGAKPLQAQFDPKAIVLDDTGNPILDSREQVTASDLDYLPFSAVGRIVTVHSGGQISSGTGFLIGRGIVLTAAHVLYDPVAGRAEQVTFTPGCMAGTRPRNAYPQTVGVEGYRVASLWDPSTTRVAADFGVIALPSAPWQDLCGYMPLRPVEATFFDRHIKGETRSFVISGYPYDRPEGTQWHGLGRFIRASGSSLDHLIDTEPGQSGAPVIALLAETAMTARTWLPVAIHSRVGTNAANFNQSRRIDKGLIDELRRLLAQLGRTL